MRNVFFCSLLFGTIIIHAQSKTISFDHLMVENGMPENYAIDIVQDNNGYIWCGTQRGLMRYDGYSVKVYKQELLDDNTAHLNLITAVFADSKGVIWAGTHGKNLLRYNAQSDGFTVYRPDSAKNETGSDIYRITEDAQHNLWIYTNNYLKGARIIERFDPETKKFTAIKMGAATSAGISAKDMIELFSDKAGRIWIGTENGIYTYDAKTKKFNGHFVATNALPMQLCGNFYEPPSEPGILYFSTAAKTAGKYSPAGFIRYDIEKNTATFYRHKTADPSSLPNDSIQCFFEDSKKNLWIGTANGLVAFDRADTVFKLFVPGNDQQHRSSNSVEYIREDTHGSLWLVGERGEGLIYFDPEKKIFTRYYADNANPGGLAANTIEQLYADRSGNIWLAFRNYGIQRINRARSRFTVFTNNPAASNGFQGNSGNSFAETTDGIYWIGTSKGLTKYDLKKGFEKITLYPEEAGVNAPSTAVFSDKDGFIWCQYGRKGLFKYDPKTGTKTNYRHHEKDSTSIPDNEVSCVYQDHHGVIWIGTGSGGLCRYNKDKENFTCFPYTHNSNNKYEGTSLDDATVSSIHEDREGRLWIGTNMGGLNLMNREKGTFTSYFNESLGPDNVDGIQDADSGQLWISSYLLGLSLFDPAKGTIVKIFNEKNGLLCDVITGICNDREGNLWISTQRGLSAINSKTFAITNYTSLQGLPAGMLSFAPFVNSKGGVFIGYKLGFFTFSPADMKPDQGLPTINLESISIVNVKNITAKMDTILVNGRQQIALEHNQNRLIFHFTGIQYENTSLNTYQYKLEEYDKDWIIAGQSRSATYTNLSPGRYTFYVKAANMDGMWNETPASIVIVIHPPWWQTWWAYLSYTLISALLIRGFISYRSRHLKRENKILEEKISTRTAELQKSLEDLTATQAQLIQSEKMASLGQLTAGIAHEIQNPLNFVNNFSELNTELIEELKSQKLKIETERDEQLENELLEDIAQNSEKINHHGKRADAIVKGMLQHSRSSSANKEPTDINKLADEYLRLAYHGLRAKDKSFNATLKTNFDESIGTINIVPQDIGRVLLNLINNAFYAVQEKKYGNETYEPTVTISTRHTQQPSGGRGVEIKVSDNGAGIPQKVLDKIFQPFFTTKPTGQGTGLGLSLAYDIIKAHGGELKVNTKENAGSEFIIELKFT